jgi:hypothetical protein
MQNSAKMSSVHNVKHQIPNRAELGRYPLIIIIQKIAFKFYNHLKGSDSKILLNKAITYREIVVYQYTEVSTESGAGHRTE